MKSLNTTVALKKLRCLAPVVAACVVLATLLLCALCAKIGGKYLGGLAWPYVSDLARDSPAYYLFNLGALVTAVLLAMNWAFNFQFQYAVLMEPVDTADVDVTMPRAVHRLLLVSLLAGVLSMLGLVFVGMFSAASYPVAHSFGAHWFFLLESVAVFLNTCISYKIQKLVRSMTDPMSYTINGVNLAPPSPEMLRLLKLQRTFHIQFVVATSFFIAMLVYLPVGLAIVQNFKRLSITECLERDLGEVYCTQTMRHNAVDTKLWNYEDDFTANQMRVVAQLGCILTLLGYSLSFVSHDYEEELERCASRGIARSTHFYNLAVLPTPPAASTPGLNQVPIPKALTGTKAHRKRRQHHARGQAAPGDAARGVGGAGHHDRRVPHPHDHAAPLCRWAQAALLLRHWARPAELLRVWRGAHDRGDRDRDGVGLQLSLPVGVAAITRPTQAHAQVRSCLERARGRAGRTLYAWAAHSGMVQHVVVSPGPPVRHLLVLPTRNARYHRQHLCHVLAAASDSPRSRHPRESPSRRGATSDLHRAARARRGYFLHRRHRAGEPRAEALGAGLSEPAARHKILHVHDAIQRKQDQALAICSNLALHQLRAVCEWVAMLALVGYSLSFKLYRDFEAEQLSDTGSAAAIGPQALEGDGIEDHLLDP